jgi:hypothetical protein
MWVSAERERIGEEEIETDHRMIDHPARTIVPFSISFCRGFDFPASPCARGGVYSMQLVPGPYLNRKPKTHFMSSTYRCVSHLDKSTRKAETHRRWHIDHPRNTWTRKRIPSRASVASSACWMSCVCEVCGVRWGPFQVRHRFRT